VPLVDPFTDTDTLARGLPLSSVTFPEMVRWANKATTKNKHANESNAFFMPRVI